MALAEVFIDTNAYAAFRRGLPEAVEIMQSAGVIALSPVVLGELLSGFAAGSRELQNRKELRTFLGRPRVHVQPVDEQTAAHYSQVHQQLRAKGRPIPTNDLWIAAGALQRGFVLFTYDGYFAHVDGLVSGALPEQLFL